LLACRRSDRPRIVIFHGVVNPPDALVGRSNGNWRRPRATPWIAEHWRE